MSSDAPPSATARAVSRGSPLAAFFLRETCLFVRGHRASWGRVGFFGAAAVILLGMILWEMDSGFVIDSGRIAFLALMGINGVYLLGLVNSNFSQVISVEREQGGLELLRITGLSPFALLVGKGTSQFVRALLSLALQAPLCALCLMLGRIDIYEMLAAYLLLAALLFFACHAGVYSSVVCKTGRAASHQTFGIFATLIIVPWLVLLFDQLSPRVLPASIISVTQWLHGLNPFTAFFSLLMLGTFSWLPVTVYFVGGFAFLALAVAQFDKFAERHARAATEPGTRAVRGNRPRGRLPRVGVRPLAWKEYYFTGTGRAGVILRWLLYPVGCLLALARTGVHRLGYAESLGRAMLTIGLLGLSFELPYVATRLFGWEVTNQTLGDIITLPIHPHRIVREKVLGHLPFLLPPLVLTIGGAVFCHHDVVREASEPWTIGFYVYFLLQIAIVLLLTIHFSFSQPRAAFGSAFILVAFANGLMSLLAILTGYAAPLAFVAVGGVALCFLVYLIQLLPFHLQLAAAK